MNFDAVNCDQVFDILTRGPFPTGTACDSGVEAHLSVCPECHRLAEALRPAIELFQESIAPEESRDLPGYWSAVATDRTQPVVSFAPKVEPLRAMPAGWAHTVPHSHWTALTAWRMAAMLALGVTLGLLLHSRVAFDGISTPPPMSIGAGAIPPTSSDHSFHLTPAEQAILAARPVDCTRHRVLETVGERRLLTASDAQQNHCCTECHNANADNVPAAAIQVTQRCQMCHNDAAARSHRSGS